MNESGDKYTLPTVSMDSDLIELAFDMERLRGDLRRGSTPPPLMRDLHGLFQILMSVISARIEGNRTTVYDALEGVSSSRGVNGSSEAIREIQNILSAMTFIDSLDPERPVDHSLVRELHARSVEGLVREGDPNPGQYRNVDVRISRAAHVPPSNVYVHAEMTELLDFVNREQATSRQMIHVAMAHHRFLWIHPFRNGNGRVSRLLSYAMLRRHGFETPGGLRAVNPTAVFGNDRDGYYDSLAAADALTNDGTVEWCTFFVRGIHDDMGRLVELNDFDFLVTRLLDPAIARLVRTGTVSPTEAEALRIVIRRQVVKAGDLAGALPGAPSQRSVAIRALLERGLLDHADEGPRFYRAQITSGPLGQAIVRQLDELGFLPSILKDDH